ncbi:MAG TPA: ABC transporter permease [Acidobacteriota bacterium]|nr:ABC transporter permease [Acidobacteriota bacterium]
MPHLLETLFQDIRFGIRVLLKNPAFTSIAVVALALGIGANSAIFSVVNAVLLRPLPYQDGGRLVKVWTQFTGIGLPNDQNWISAPEFVDLRQLNNSFSHLAAISSASFNFTSGGVPERVEGAQVSASFFSLLGVQAQLGRIFSQGEDQPGRERVVILSDGLWKRRFGADRDLIGRSLTLNGQSYTLIGILPVDFQFPGDAEMWTPLVFEPADLDPGNRGSHGLEVLARIKPDLSLGQARADMAIVTRRIIEQNPNYPYRDFHFEVRLVSLIDELVGDLRTPLWILMGAVGFVLLIACGNVANLQLARASAREREIAIRGALGAGRGRLIRQLLTESILLSLLGAAAGLFLAYWNLRVLINISHSSYPRIAGAQMDSAVLGFTAVASLMTGILFGVVPALQSSKADLHESLTEGGRTAGAGPGSQRLRRMLITAEIALSIILLVGAGLLLKSFANLQHVDAGFDSSGVLTMRISLPQPRYSKPEQLSNFFRQLMDRVSKLPGVDSAGAVSALPLTGQGSSGTTTVDSRVVTGPNASPEADWRPATPGYFRAMGIVLRRGRFFDEHDTQLSEPVAIIDESMAASYWPNENPIGRRLKRGGRQSPNRWMKIVGVVRHVRYRTLEARSRVQLYWPHAQNPWPAMSLAIHTSASAASDAPKQRLVNPESLAAAIRQEVAAIDKDQPVYRIRTMAQILSDSIGRRRLLMVLLSIFAGMALLLAAVGIYGVMSYAVTQRAHEIGIRMALGAQRRQVVGLVLAQSLGLIAAGVLAGMLGSLVLSRLITTLLFNVREKDPSTFAVVALMLTAVALLASYIPARRATQLDPMHVLRQE